MLTFDEVSLILYKYSGTPSYLLQYLLTNELGKFGLSVGRIDETDLSKT